MDSTPLPQRWKEKLAAVERELGRVLPDPVTAAWTREQSGHDLFAIPDLMWQRITDPARDLLKRGGKRWRPLFMLLCAEMYGDWRRALPLTPMVEIAHNGSLIVDDIEDGSVQRRGEAAEHVKFGLDLALNAGNLMYFLASRIIDGTTLDERRRLVLHRFFGEDLIRLHFGQGLDILWHRDHENIPSEDQYMEMCRLKTGGLSRLAARAGIIAVGGGKRTAERLGRLAEDFGACFQIVDDVKNLREGVPGKQRGDDIIEGKKSLPIILHLQACPADRAKIRELFRIARGQEREAAWKAVDELIALIRPSGCLEQAQARAEGLFTRTRAELERISPACGARDQLVELVDLLVTG
jgi:geranylgeranyl pyrophosphate synthase